MDMDGLVLKRLHLRFENVAGQHKWCPTARRSPRNKQQDFWNLVEALYTCHGRAPPKNLALHCRIAFQRLKTQLAVSAVECGERVAEPSEIPIARRNMPRKPHLPQLGNIL